MANRGATTAAKYANAVLRSPVGVTRLSTIFPLRSGMGMPVGTRPPPTAPLPEEHELEWDDGSPFPEPCIDNHVPEISKYEALAWLTGGLSFFGALAGLATWKAKLVEPRFPQYPYDDVPKHYPYKEELAFVKTL